MTVGIASQMVRTKNDILADSEQYVSTFFHLAAIVQKNVSHP
jgi:hypothetical protein